MFFGTDTEEGMLAYAVGKLKGYKVRCGTEPLVPSKGLSAQIKRWITEKVPFFVKKKQFYLAYRVKIITNFPLYG
jgi:hypothetical protein